MTGLWKDLRHLFEPDDGGLDDICIRFAVAGAIPKAFARLRERARRISVGEGLLWSKNDSRPFDSVSNPAELVVSGEARSFHVVFEGIEVGGVIVPDLGAFVDPDAIELDYRKIGWGPSQLEALFQLLVELTSFDPGAEVLLVNALPAVSKHFQEVFSRYRDGAA